MAEIRHLENQHDIIFFCRGWSNLDKISQTGAEWHVDCGNMVEIETRCIIPVWRTYGRIQWHVVPEPPATLQGVATWRIQCHDPRAACHIAGCCNQANSMACHPRATYHIAGCCHLVNSLSCSQSHMPHCRVQSPGEINVMMVPQCRCKNSIRHYWLKIVFFVSSPIHLLNHWMNDVHRVDVINQENAHSDTDTAYDQQIPSENKLGKWLT